MYTTALRKIIKYGKKWRKALFNLPSNSTHFSTVLQIPETQVSGTCSTTILYIYFFIKKSNGYCCWIFLLLFCWLTIIQKIDHHFGNYTDTARHRKWTQKMRDETENYFFQRDWFWCRLKWSDHWNFFYIIFFFLLIKSRYEIFSSTKMREITLQIYIWSDHMILSEPACFLELSY